jgi:phosphatidylglycerophosphatase A
MTCKWFVTWFYTGCIAGAPGTWGALGTLPLAYVLHWQFGHLSLLYAALILYLLGTWATHQYLRQTSSKDPSEVVIDEVVGQLIALWPVSFILTLSETAPHIVYWPTWVAAFALFRFFDILKPWPIRKFEQIKGAHGVMIDDVIAGLFAAIVLSLSTLLFGQIV